MKIYTRADLLAITNNAELVGYIAGELGVPFPRSKVIRFDDTPIDLPVDHVVEEQEIRASIEQYCQRNGFNVHFPDKDADCWLYQGILHRGSSILLTVSNNSGPKRLGGKPHIMFTACFKPGPGAR